MNVLKKLKQTDKPYFGLPKLSLGYHKVIGFSVSEGIYGRSVIAELEDEIIFLPRNLSDKLNNEDIVELNKSEVSVYLFFGGKHENKYWIVRLVDRQQMLEELKKKNDAIDLIEEDAQPPMKKKKEHAESVSHEQTLNEQVNDLDLDEKEGEGKGSEN